MATSSMCDDIPADAKVHAQVTRNCFKGKGDIAVFTSGGDSQGTFCLD